MRDCLYTCILFTLDLHEGDIQKCNPIDVRKHISSYLDIQDTKHTTVCMFQSEGDDSKRKVLEVSKILHKYRKDNYDDFLIFRELDWCNKTTNFGHTADNSNRFIMI